MSACASSASVRKPANAITDAARVSTGSGSSASTASRAPRAASGSPASAASGEARAERRRAADLAQAAPVGPVRDCDQARLVAVGDAERLGEREQRLEALLAALPREDALAPDDHDVAGVAQHVGRGAHGARGVAAARRRSPAGGRG